MHVAFYYDLIFSFVLIIPPINVPLYFAAFCTSFVT